MSPLTWKESVNSCYDYFSEWNSSTNTRCAGFSLEFLGMLLPLHTPHEFNIPKTWNVLLVLPCPVTDRALSHHWNFHHLPHRQFQNMGMLKQSHGAER